MDCELIIHFQTIDCQCFFDFIWSVTSVVLLRIALPSLQDSREILILQQAVSSNASVIIVFFLFGITKEGCQGRWPEKADDETKPFWLRCTTILQGDHGLNMLVQNCKNWFDQWMLQTGFVANNCHNLQRITLFKFDFATIFFLEFAIFLFTNLTINHVTLRFRLRFFASFVLKRGFKLTSQRKPMMKWCPFYSAATQSFKGIMAEHHCISSCQWHVMFRMVRRTNRV